MTKIQVARSHYFNLNYDSKQRWVSYWYQISEVLKHNPKSVLEIGIGNKLVSNYLKSVGTNVITCDFDKSLVPDVVANVLKLPFKNSSFDIVLCSEVLEHLPFKYFLKALKQINRVTKNIAVITLPHFSITTLYLGFKIIPYVPKINLSLKIDLPIKHKFEGEHYWEIGKKNYSLSKIKEKIVKSGFKLESSFFPAENPKHHFFILRK